MRLPKTEAVKVLLKLHAPAINEPETVPKLLVPITVKLGARITESVSASSPAGNVELVGSELIGLHETVWENLIWLVESVPDGGLVVSTTIAPCNVTGPLKLTLLGCMM